MSSANVLAHVRVGVTAVLGLVGRRCGVLGDSYNDDDLLDGNLVDNTGGSVCRGGHNLRVGVSVLLGRGRSGCDDGRSRRRLHDRCRSSRLGRLRCVDVELGDAAGTLALGRRVALDGHRGDARDDGLSSRLAGATWLEWVGVSGAVLNGDVSAETLGRSGTVIVGENRRELLDIALVLLGFGLEFASEEGAVFGASGLVGTSRHGRLQDIDVPAVDEIGVVPVAWSVLDGKVRYHIGLHVPVGSPLEKTN